MDKQASGPLQGRHILIVEDDGLIAADLAQALEDRGASVVGPARSVARALAALAANPEVDAAVLDINLGPEKSFEVADVLQQRSVPFVFTTGYDGWVIPARFGHVRRCEKPVDTLALEKALLQ